MPRRRQDNFFPSVGALALTTLLFIVSYQVVTRFENAADSSPRRPSVIVVPGEKEIPANMATSSESAVETPLPPAEANNTALVRYLMVTDSCGPFFDGECVRVRSGPGTEYSVVASLRNGMVLKAGESVTKDGVTWQEIVFDEWLRYPERVSGEWYVSAALVNVIEIDPPAELSSTTVASTSKRIVVDRSDQTLTTYENGTMIKTYTISTGLELTPTPRGTFSVYYKTPTRYMQGPLPWLADQQYYDLPGVPWNLYFTEQGAVIHGAYWHDSFGKPFSHGCVNMPPSEARELYDWAPLGVTVVVQD